MYHKHKAHPWHGISIGTDAPNVIKAFIEIVPADTVKYEIDKESGYLMVDRPQKFSSVVPVLYGFVPQTYCGVHVAEYAKMQSGKDIISGDKDPLDICVLTQRSINHSDIILNAIPIGGFRLIDKGEADDKIIAVLKDDEVYGNWKDISECPVAIVNRLKHYFLTYKGMPDLDPPACEITHTYGRADAHEVIKRSREDYKIKFNL